MSILKVLFYISTPDVSSKILMGKGRVPLFGSPDVDRETGNRAVLQPAPYPARIPGWRVKSLTGILSLLFLLFFIPCFAGVPWVP